jgi:hypothetical protein
MSTYRTYRQQQLLSQMQALYDTFSQEVEGLFTNDFGANLRAPLTKETDQMSAAQQAKARRRQMRNGMAHLPPNKRPGYKKLDAATSASRLEKLIATERRMQNKKKK